MFNRSNHTESVPTPSNNGYVGLCARVCLCVSVKEKKR